MPEARIVLDSSNNKYVVVVDEKIIADNIPTHAEALLYRAAALSQMEIV